MYPPAKTNPVGLSEKIKGKVDRVLAECANIDMEFQKICNCLNINLDSIFIDSSTLEYRSQDYGYATYLDNS